MTEYHEYLEELQADGWELRDNVDPDLMNVYYEHRCPNCRHYGMIYKSFERGEEHKALIHCQICDHAEEL